MAHEIPLPKVTSFMAEKSEMDRHRELEDEVGIDRAFRMVRIAEAEGRVDTDPIRNPWADKRPYKVRLTERFEREGYSKKAISLYFAL
jgi:hypothetical protein